MGGVNTRRPTSTALVAAGALLVAAPGCAPRHVQHQNFAGEPLLSTGGPATEHFRFNAALMSGGLGVNWGDGSGAYTTADSVVAACEEYLAKVGALVQPREITDPRPPVFPPMYAAPPSQFWGVPRTMTIVSLQPVVVVISAGTTAWTDASYASWDQQTVGASQWWRTVLRHGFRSGTRLPYSDDVTWFSPTLGEGPKPPERISTDKRTIPMVWGNIVLVRDGDEWVVTSAPLDPYAPQLP